MSTPAVVVVNRRSPAWDAAKPFITGGISACIATACIQPIDMVKVRLQLSGEGGTVAIKNPIVMTKLIISEGGVAKLYSGLGAALLRQVTYGTARLGIFRTITDAWTEPGKPLEFWKRAVSGLTAGGVGAFIGVPADLALIRMQADSTLPLDQRRNYRGVFHALSSIVKNEGFGGLFAGCIPTITRAMAVNCGMLATYDQSKDLITEYNGPGRLTNFYASMIAGFFASAASLPFDFVKTRVQKQRAGPDGILPYKNGIDCAIKTFKSEGPLAFYKGFATYYVRIAPHAVIALNVLDFLNGELKARGL